MINSTSIGKEVFATVMPKDSNFHQVKGILKEVRNGYAIIQCTMYATIWENKVWKEANENAATVGAQVQYVKEM